MKNPAPLPDLDDDAEFRRRLSPLVNSVLPDDRKTGGPRSAVPATPQARNAAYPDIPKVAQSESGNSDSTEDRQTGATDNTQTGITDNRITGLIRAAEAQANIEALRGVKKRFEYLIPERVGRALAEDAAARGVSATTRLLEVLRDAGYPVIQEDMIDLRKMPKR
jgi:hypothetical protein